MSKTQEQRHFETLKTTIHLNFFIYIAVMHFENDEKKQRKTDSVLLIRKNREAMETDQVFHWTWKRPSRSVPVRSVVFESLSLTQQGEELGGVCFSYLMLNRTFFELNAE